VDMLWEDLVEERRRLGVVVMGRHCADWRYDPGLSILEPSMFGKSTRLPKC
jgi:hypothetical protein